MKRRNFLKGLAATSAGFAVSGTVGSLSKARARSSGQQDFGEVKSLKVHVISETSWFDNPTLGKDIKAAGGINTNQYEVAYTEENLGGYSALIEVEALDGSVKKYLLDSGWSNDWMDYVFAKDGIDKMLKNKEIDTLFTIATKFSWILPSPALKKIQRACPVSPAKRSVTGIPGVPGK